MGSLHFIEKHAREGLQTILPTIFQYYTLNYNRQKKYLWFKLA